MRKIVRPQDVAGGASLLDIATLGRSCTARDPLSRAMFPGLADVPRRLRRDMPVTVPPRWASAVPRQVAQTLGVTLTSQRLLYSAFIDEGYCGITPEFTSMGLQEIGASVLEYIYTTWIETTVGTTIDCSTTVAELTSHRVLQETGTRVWHPLSSLILSSSGKSMLKTKALGTLHGHKEATGSSNPMATSRMVRAVVAAVYLDQGLEAAVTLVKAHMQEYALALGLAE